MRAVLIPFLFLFAFIQANGAAWAADRVLFKNDRQPVVDYQRQVAAIEEGDHLLFTGAEVKVGKKLGCGSTTCVFEILEPQFWADKALRIPKTDRSPDQRSMLEFIGSFVSGDEPLKKAGVPSVTIHASKSDQFIVVDKVESKFTLHDLFENPFRHPPDLRQKYVDDLRDFAAKSAALEKIGDFRPDQLHYVEGRGWLLLDWTEFHETHSPHFGGSENIFDETFEAWLQHYNLKNQSLARWLRDVRDQLTVSISDARRQLKGSSPSLLNRCTGFFRSL